MNISMQVRLGACSFCWTARAGGASFAYKRGVCVQAENDERVAHYSSEDKASKHMDDFQMKPGICIY